MKLKEDEEVKPVVVRIGTKRNDGDKTVAIGIDIKKKMVYMSDSSKMLDSVSTRRCYRMHAFKSFW